MKKIKKFRAQLKSVIKDQEGYLVTVRADRRDQPKGELPLLTFHQKNWPELLNYWVNHGEVGGPFTVTLETHSERELDENIDEIEDQSHHKRNQIFTSIIESPSDSNRYTPLDQEQTGLHVVGGAESIVTYHVSYSSYDHMCHIKTWYYTHIYPIVTTTFCLRTPRGRKVYPTSQFKNGRYPTELERFIMNTVKTKLLKNDPSLKQSQQITIEVDLNHYSELDDRRLDLLQDKFKWWKHWTMTDSELWFLDHCQSAFIYALKHRYIQSYSWKEGFDYTPNDSDDPRAEAQKEAYQDWLNETMNSQFYMDVGWSDEYDEPSSEPIVTVDISDHPDRERLLKWPKEAKYF